MEAVTPKCEGCTRELTSFNSSISSNNHAKAGFCSSCQTHSSIPSNNHSSQICGVRQRIMTNLRGMLKSKMHMPGSTTAARPPKAAPSLNYKPSPTMPRSKKRALVCGVSYNDKNGKYKLQGTINDVKNIRDLLISKFDFRKEYIRVLTEEEPPEFTPTKVNFENWLKWLVEGCQSGDSLVFYYSGHGLRQPEFVGHEIDGFDETICPLDFINEGMIDDNYINSTIVKPLKKGVTLHAIIDACHSGTVLDLPYVYNKKLKSKWEHHLNKYTEGTVICISACKDDQTASDTSAFTGKTMNGALTYILVELLKQYPGPTTYGDLLDLMEEKINAHNEDGCFVNTTIIRRVFQGRSIEMPQLSSSEKFDVYERHLKL